MTSIPCDIALLPTDDLGHTAIRLSGQLEQHRTLFTLRDDAYYPHVSLYMTQLKSEDLDAVKTILAGIAGSTPQLNLTANRYDQSGGYIDAEYTRNEAIGRLQMAVIAAINPLRDGLREKYEARILTSTGKIRENLETYGYREVGELFRPHMTFTRFASGQPIDVSELPQPSQFSGLFVKLGLFEMGDNGTCARKIAEVDLY